MNEGRTLRIGRLLDKNSQCINHYVNSINVQLFSRVCGEEDGVLHREPVALAFAPSSTSSAVSKLVDGAALMFVPVEEVEPVVEEVLAISVNLMLTFI
jgi:hypothetical protein